MNELRLTSEIQEKLKDYYIYSNFWQPIEQIIFSAFIAIFLSLLCIDIFKQHRVDIGIRIGTSFFLLVSTLSCIFIFSKALDYTKPLKVRKDYYIMAFLFSLIFNTLVFVLSILKQKLEEFELEYLVYLITGFLPFTIIIWSFFREFMLSNSKKCRENRGNELFKSGCIKNDDMNKKLPKNH